MAKMPASRNYASKDTTSRHLLTFVRLALQPKVPMSAITSSMLQNSKCKCRISCFWQGLGVFLKRKERRILHTTTFVMFLMLGNHDSLHFGIIPLTPSATKTIILGSPKDSPSFWQKRKITIHCYYSPVTIHWYCSLRNFAYLRGAVLYIWASVSYA